MRERLDLFGHVSALAVVAIMLLASCSTTPASPSKSESPTGQTTPSTGQSTPSAAKSPTPVKPQGSLVVLGRPASMSTLDPTVQGSGNNYQGMSAAVFDTLVDVSPAGQLRPALAERWEISADGKTHTFYIRKGVKFHDGSDLTGEDVKFSLERIMSTKSTNIDTTVWATEVAGIDLKDAYTVVLRLTSPQFELIKGFNDFGNSQAVVPKKYIETKGEDYFRQNPVGSGPWKVLSFQASVKVELEAVESHWREVPKFKNMTLVNVAEEATKVAMFKTGELDLAPIVPDSAPGLKAAGMRIVGHDGASQYSLALYYDLDNPDKYAFGNIDVRKALSLAINRKELGDKLLAGYAVPSALFFALPTAYFWDANLLKPDPYDPEGAKKLLTGAGYANGFTTKIWTSAGSGVQGSLNEAVGGYWQKVGVSAQMETATADALRALRYPKPQPGMYNTSFAALSGGGIFNFERMVTIFHSTKGVHLNLRNPRLDELIDKVPATKDLAEKKKLALEAAVLAKNGYSNIPVLDIQTVIAMSKKIGDLTLTKGIEYYANTLSSASHPK
ncbi:MAG: ABC transporter substrate-binding protein [Dehalococcoidia bacterium]|nr:ABC transporter substrate-binding protein [Dehalococcoidia bacterium]